MFSSYIAIGDSFTEGFGDPRPDGSLRGWADRVAAGLANGYSASPDGNNRPFRYANLAIRGRKLGPIIAEQLQPALAQSPDVMSFNAGGNNMLRPKFDPAESIDQIVEAVEAIRVTGTHVLLLAGPDPVNNLPMGHVFSSRGEQYTELATNAVAGRIAPGIVSKNWLTLCSIEPGCGYQTAVSHGASQLSVTAAQMTQFTAQTHT